MIPGTSVPPVPFGHKVRSDPNLRESDAHEVPGPRDSTARASSVLFTTVRTAARRSSRLMKNRCVRRSAASVSASAPGIAVYRWHSMFAQADFDVWHHSADARPATIEGGDVLVIGNRALLVGISLALRAADPHLGTRRCGAHGWP
jgi:Arginine deiminase